MSEPRASLLDVRGYLCPVPVLMTARVVADLDAGERLEVVGDDPEIAIDLPAWCEATGNRLLSMERDGALIRCCLEKVPG
jgi:TusA-related sulfurtransferase